MFSADSPFVFKRCSLLPFSKIYLEGRPNLNTLSNLKLVSAKTSHIDDPNPPDRVCSSNVINILQLETYDLKYSLLISSVLKMSNTFALWPAEVNFSNSSMALPNI